MVVDTNTPVEIIIIIIIIIWNNAFLAEAVSKRYIEII